MESKKKVTFNAVVCCYKDIERIRLNILKRSLVLLRETIIDVQFEDYTGLQFGNDKWIFATTEVCLSEGEMYHLWWTVDDSTGSSRSAKMKNVSVKKQSSTMSVIIHDKSDKLDWDALNWAKKEVQGSFISLDIFMKNNIDIGNDIVKELLDKIISQYINQSTMQEYVNKWLDCRLGKLSQTQTFFMLYVLHKLKITSPKKFSKEESIHFLEALRCQQTLPEDLHLSQDFKDELLKGAHSSRLDALYYLSQHISRKEVQHFTTKVKFNETDINQYNWNDVEKKVSQVICQLCCSINKEDKAKFFEILGYIVSNLSTVNDMLKCINWFLQYQIQTKVNTFCKREHVWKCLSRRAFDLIESTSKSANLPNLVELLIWPTRWQIYRYLDQDTNMKCFKTLCQIVRRGSIHELQHIIDFLHSGWLSWVLPELENDQQRNLLWHLNSFITKCTPSEIQIGDPFFYRYRIAIAPSMLDDQSRSRCDKVAINRYESKLFSRNISFDRLKMCFYGSPVDFNTNELMYVSHHITRSSLSAFDKIQCFTDIFVQVTKPTSHDIEAVIKCIVATSLIYEMEVPFDTGKLLPNAEQYLKTLFTIQTGWHFLSTDLMLEPVRSVLLDVLRNIYQKQRERQCSFAHADFLKRKKHDFKEFIHLFEGIESIRNAWCDVIDNTINDADNHRRGVMHLRRLVKLIGDLNNSTAIGIDITKLQKEIEHWEKMTAIGSDCLISNANKDEFWGSFQSIVKFHRKYDVSDSTIFFHICLDYFKDSKCAMSLEDFCQKVNGVCIPRYEEIWKNIALHGLQIQVSDVITYLQSITDTDMLNRELLIVKQTNIQTIPEEVKAALESFICRSKRQEYLDVCKIFKIIFKTQQNILKSSEMENISLGELHDTINWIDGNFVDEVKDLHILSELSKCGDVVEFLVLIIQNEDDLRNLGDIIEEHDESSLHIGLVADIIDVKRFIQSLLDIKGLDMISQLIQSSTEDNNDARKSTLSSKINACKSNLSSIKDLYFKLADRQETTRLMIRDTLENGTFDFTLQENKSSYISEIFYETSKCIKKHLTLDDLTDSKSRVLLVVNSEMNEVLSTDDVACYKNFIRMITDATHVTDLLDDLYNSGYFQYVQSVSSKSGCWRSVRTISSKSHDLNSLMQILENRYRIWVNVLREVRLECFYLNFFVGNKLWLLEQSNRTKKSTFETILKQLDMSHTETTVTYPDPDGKEDDNMDWTEETNMLRHETALRENLMKLGRSLETHVQAGPGEAFSSLENDAKADTEEAYTGIIRLKIPLNMSPSEVHRVQPGTVSLVTIDKGKSHPMSVLLQLYQDTTGKFPRLWQVLFCHQDTLIEEAELLLQRCRGASKNQLDALFTIVNAELLSRDVRSYIINEIITMYKTGEHFMLGIIISEKQRDPFLGKFPLHVTHSVTGLSRGQMAKYLTNKWGRFEIVTSETPGLGKTEYIKTQAFKNNLDIVNVSVYGSIDRESLIKQLSQLIITRNTMLHIDVGRVSNPQVFDTLILELTVFGIVQSRQHVFSLDTEFICVEIANQGIPRDGNPDASHFPVQNGHTTLSLKEIGNDISFSSIFTRKHLQWRNFEDYIVSPEINSSVQVVCHYLLAAENKELDSEDIRFVGEECKTSLADSMCRELLKRKFKHIPRHSMSFASVEIYLNVFAGELRSLSASNFLSTATINITVDEHNVRSQFFHELDKIAMAFTPLTPLETHDTSEEQDVETEITRIMKWEDSNHTLLVFNNQDIETVTPFYRKVEYVDESIRKLFESQLNRELPNYESMEDSKAGLKHILEKVCRTSRHKLAEPKFDYALTPDNLLKMILVYKRIMAGIPVIIMGETGCGKTLLLTYLAYICEVPFYTMDIHAGTKRKDIMDFIQKPIEEAEHLKSGREAKSNMIWIFFDEINTCDHLCLLSEIMLKHSCEGTKLPTNLVFLAACNPYIIRKEGPLQTSGGLSGKCRHDEKSNLVYRVEQLPKQMLPYVWDFGALQEKDELQYIKEMIKTINAEIKDEKLQQILSTTISKLQTFTRKVEGTQYCVSLRDIRRCIELASFFASQWFDKKELAEIIEHLPYGERDTGETELKDECKLRSIILALVQCYYCRIVEDQKNHARSEFLNLVSGCFIGQYPHITPNYVNAVIIGEQMDLLNKMTVPKGVAKNSALRENVFVILICVLAHIPIFVVGNPGSSKSLSMQLIRSNLRGLDSKTEFFKKLPAVYVLSYQGSDSSTSEGIMKIFHKAQKSLTNSQQEETTNFRVLPLVLLDEVGLAENSPRNPLKVLHSLLEPEHGTKKTAGKASVVGISNWALDPAKMNRAVYLSRVDPTTCDLYMTAKTLRDAIGEDCDRFISDKLLKKVTDAYSNYTTNSEYRHFHGLRDFYALVKYISSAVLKGNTQSFNELDIGITSILENGLRRNFGGLRRGQFDNSMASCCTELKLVDEGNWQSSTNLKMISENVNDEMARHLMIITDITNEDLLRSLMEQQLKGREYKIMFGSLFQNDISEDYFYRVLSNIILYMEQGVTIVLKGLTSIYGSLYDMLNQNYTIVGGKRSCRIALSPIWSPLCEVHKDFRCIVLMNENEVDTSDPPFLNRFEKQFLTISDVLLPEQKEAVIQMQSWIECFRMIEETEPNPKSGETKDKHIKIDEKGVFLGFHNNMITSSVVSNMAGKQLTCDEGVEQCKSKLVSLMCPEGFLQASRSKLLVQSPKEFRDIENRYLKLPHHYGLIQFLKTFHLAANGPSMTIIYTHTSIHYNLESMINAEVSACVESLSNFRSEREFKEMVRKFWFNKNEERMDTVLILQCSPQVDGPRMSSARYMIHECKQEAMKNIGKQAMAKHVCIIVHVDRRETELSDSSWQYSALLGWNQVTIDSLFLPSYCFKTIVGKTVLQLIADDVVDFEKIACEELMWALSCIRYIHEQNIESISDVRTKVSETNILALLKANLTKNKDSLQLPALEEPHDRYGWLYNIATDMKLLSIHGTFDATVKETLREKIRRILAKCLFVLASNSAWIDIRSSDDDTITFWEFCIQSSNILDISSSSVPEPVGSASFVICSKTLTLRFPLFLVFHEKIEKKMKQNQEIMNSMTSETDTHVIVPDTLLQTLEHTVSQAVNEAKFHDYLAGHVDTFLDDLFTVFASNLHESPSKECLHILHKFLKKVFKPMTDRLEKAVSKVAIVYFHMLTARDVLLAKLQLISTYIEFSNGSESPRHWQAEGIDKIVDQVCELTLPTRDVLKSVGGCTAWKRKVTSVILCAGRIVEDTSCVFHFLSLCRNFCTLIQHFKENELRLANLADLWKNVQNTIATPEVFRFFQKEIEHFRRKAENDLSVLMVEDFAGTFFIKAFDANPDNCFLTTALEKMYTNKDGNLAVFASPLLFRIIERDIEDGKNPDDSLLVTGCGVIESIDCIDKEQFPNLFVLDEFLRKQDEIDNHVAALCCNLIQKVVFGQLDEDEVLFDTAKKSVFVVVKSQKCTMQLIFSIALISAFFKTLINVPKEDLEKKLNQIFNSKLEEDELQRKRVNALKVYLLRHLRQIYSIHDLVDIGGQLEVFQSTSQLSATHLCYSPMSDVKWFREAKEKLLKFEDSQTQENEFGLDDILVKAKNQMKMALALSAVIVERFVLSRSRPIHQLASTEEQFRATISKKISANLSGTEKEFSRLIELLLNETILSEFITFAKNHGGDQTKVLQQMSVMTHIVSIILVQSKNGTFYQCLHSESGMLLPAGGTPVPKLKADNIEIPGSWTIICPSCTVQVVGSHSTSSKDQKQLRCPTCQANLEQVSFHSQNAQRRTVDTLETGYHRRSKEELQRPDLSIRALHPIAYRVLSIITHSIFLIRHYINVENEQERDEARENEELLKLFDLYVEGLVDSEASVKIRTFLFEQIDQDWNVLQILLQTNIENTAIFLHSVIKESSDILTESFKSLSFEMQFSNRIVDIYKSEYLKKIMTQSYRCMGINDTDLAFEIDELCEESSLQLSRFFGYKRDQTFTPFKMDVLNNIYFSSELCEQHMFLCLFISMKDQLECLRHMKPIIDWYRVLFNNLSHRIKRKDARRSIKEFIDSGALGSSSQDHYNRFKHSWNAVQQSWKNITGDEPTFDQMSDESELAACLDQSEDQPGHLKSILDVLVEIQNKFLLKAYYIATSGRCHALKMQMNIDCIAALETIPLPESKKEIIMFIWDDRPLINAYIYTQKGENVKYNFASIERQLCTKLVLNKKLLTTEHPLFRFVFLDKLLVEFTNLLQVITLAIPQEKINKQIQEDICSRYLPGDAKSKKLLEQIEIVLSFLQRTGGNSKQQLHKYTSDLQLNFATTDLSSEPFIVLQLCHVVNLYEIFEDIMATPSLLKLSNDVFETLRTDASTNFESALNKLELKDIVSLSSVVRRFAYRYLQSSVVDVDKTTTPLADAMSKMTITPDLTEVIRSIPPEVQVQHANEAINIIEIQLEKLKLRQSNRPTDVQQPFTIDGPVSQPKPQRRRTQNTKRIQNLDLL